MINELCEICNEWIEGRCGGIPGEPGGCWVQAQATEDDWHDETGQMVQPEIVEDVKS